MNEIASRQFPPPMPTKSRLEGSIIVSHEGTDGPSVVLTASIPVELETGEHAPGGRLWVQDDTEEVIWSLDGAITPEDEIDATLGAMFRDLAIEEALSHGREV